ncbi:MAG: quinone-dependent dihydroorotate dehydrogenase [Bacteroidia bacterium]
MYKVLRWFLFLLPPERAHYFTMRMFKWALNIPGLANQYQFDNNRLKLDGLNYKNRVGMAAGFDKDGKFIEQLNALNFGFVEIGTVTPRPQGGNPKPRLFRLKHDQALINRMGFNNEGVKALKGRLETFRKKNKASDMLIGLNIGKNKLTPNEKAFEDYIYCYKSLYELGDFFVVNVSSPNTPNLRELQEKGPLRKILAPLVEYRNSEDIYKPLYLKIAPDMPFEHLDQIIELQEELGFEGIVATNTSVDRTLLQFTTARTLSDIGDGGLSGAPVLQVSNSFVKHIRSKSNMTIIGVGGIHTTEDGQSKLDAGANLLEVYTGFIYSGPSLIKKLAQL